MKSKFYSWSHYWYRIRPLVFMCMPDLSETQILNLLRWFDQAYGNTEQETTDWALEYQLLTRNLIHEKALLTNPMFLALDFEESDCSGGLKNILSETQYKDFLTVFKMTEEQKMALCGKDTI